MATWDEMTPRERDAWVAEHVMGWRPPNTPRAIRPVFPIPWDIKWDYFNPPPEVEEWRNNYFWREPCGACFHGPPWHTTNASADYLVLQKVREWEADAKCAFSFRLQQRLALKRYDGPLIAYAMNYEPGDYSHAAYLTIKETP